jgi:hypothetical protein
MVKDMKLVTFCPFSVQHTRSRNFIFQIDWLTLWSRDEKTHNGYWLLTILIIIQLHSIYSES